MATYTQFEVTANSYTTTTGAPHKLVNTPKGFLPSTGGTGIVLFVALGAVMIALAGTYFVSRRKDNDNEQGRIWSEPRKIQKEK